MGFTSGVIGWLDEARPGHAAFFTLLLRNQFVALRHTDHKLKNARVKTQSREEELSVFSFFTFSCMLQWWKWPPIYRGEADMRTTILQYMNIGLSLPLHLFGHTQNQSFTYCRLTLLYNTPPCPNICHVYALLKTPPKNLVGKKEKRVHHRLCLCCTCCLVKNLAWENPVGKTHQGKKSTTVDVALVLRDRPVIFVITVMGYGFRVGLPLNHATL